MSTRTLSLPLLAALLGMPFAAVPAAAVTLHVDPAGAAGAPCTAVAPCPLIADALALSAAGDDVRVAAGNYFESGLVIPHDLAIVGDTALTTVVDGGGSGPIFTVNGAASVVLLSRLTLTNGDAGFTSGGAILHAAGDLVVTGSRLIGNLALSGGAIAQQSPGTLLVLTSLLEGNTSSATGGAIHCDACGGVEIGLSVVNGNAAGTTGGAIHIEESELGVWLSGLSDNAADHGGAIRALLAPVAILDSALQRNQAELDGGALSATSTVNIQRSTLAENIAGNNGGAVIVEGNPPVAVSNSTFSGNTAFCGGAFSLVAGLAGGPVALMGASTFFGNVSAVAFCGDHFQGSATSLELYNSIVDGGFGSACNAAMTGGAHNLIDDGTCNTGAASFNLGAVTGLDPALAYNGGPTRTHLIDPASNAVDAGRNAACLNPWSGTPLVMDQRAQTRPFDFTLTGVATCDIGSVELQ
jgi:hypothetical protein